MAELSRHVRALQCQGSLELPLPGAGATGQRHEALLQLGRMDLSVARIVEAHTDAIAILAEAGPGRAAQCVVRGLGLRRPARSGHGHLFAERQLAPAGG